MARVIHTGQAMVDLVVEVDHLPPRGGNVMAERTQRHAGGAVTILVAAARNGAQALHAGAIGTGPHGDLIRHVLSQEGIDVSAPAVPDQDTGVCVVMVEPSAERTFITTRAAERSLSLPLLRTSEPAPGDLVCVTGYSLYEPTRDPLLGWLEELPAGVQVILDPGAAFAHFDPELVQQMLSRTQIWTSNAQEAAELTGTDETDPAHGAAAVSDLLADDAVVIVRDGPRGCHLRHAGQTRHIPGFPQTPVDTNGAGDTHTGVLCAEIVRGTPWDEAARRANAAGAIKVTRRGPTTAPGRGEVDAFLTQFAR